MAIFGPTSFSTQNMLISVLGIIAWAKPSRIRQTWVFLSMKCCFLTRVRPVGYAYLNNIFWTVVVCTITAMRRGEKQKGTWVFKFLFKLNYSNLSQSHLLASMSYVLLSYRSCDQVKPEICWWRSQGQSQLLKTNQEPQLERSNLQKWQTNVLSTLWLLDSNTLFIWTFSVQIFQTCSPGCSVCTVLSTLFSCVLSGTSAGMGDWVSL